MKAPQSLFKGLADHWLVARFNDTEQAAARRRLMIFAGQPKRRTISTESR
jgi:hypothetical protein